MENSNLAAGDTLKADRTERAAGTGKIGQVQVAGTGQIGLGHTEQAAGTGWVGVDHTEQAAGTAKAS